MKSLSFLFFLFKSLLFIKDFLVVSSFNIFLSIFLFSFPFFIEDKIYLLLSLFFTFVKELLLLKL